MKYLYLPILFALAFGYSKYFEYSKSAPVLTNMQTNQSKNRTPASTKVENKVITLKDWLKKF